MTESAEKMTRSTAISVALTVAPVMVMLSLALPQLDLGAKLVLMVALGVAVCVPMHRYIVLPLVRKVLT